MILRFLNEQWYILPNFLSTYNENEGLDLYHEIILKLEAFVNNST